MITDEAGAMSNDDCRVSNEGFRGVDKFDICHSEFDISYAHSLPVKPKGEWQRLDEHLKNVAEMARGFADAFGAGKWGYLAGL